MLFDPTIEVAAWIRTQICAAQTHSTRTYLGVFTVRLAITSACICALAVAAQMGAHVVCWVALPLNRRACWAGTMAQTGTGKFRCASCPRKILYSLPGGVGVC